MNEAYKTPQSALENVSSIDRFKKLKYTLIGLFSFIIGGLFSGIAVYRTITDSYEKSTDLLINTSELATLDRDIRFLNLNDKELRCILSKFASYDFDKYSNLEIEESFIWGAPGLPGLVRNHRDVVVEKYNSSNIAEHAATCESPNVF